jgi:ATP-dependent RNA helicase RhlE
MTFESLGLSAPILKSLKACDYRQPTPIQVKAIPPALAGKDVLGCAQTGTGKTCAFGAPILQRLAATPRKTQGIRALILTPTRELALQIGESLKEYGANLPLRCAVIFGGVGQVPQVERLKQGVDILTATPGRLLDLHNQGLINLSHVEVFVLDEADRMLDMGFINDVRKILALLPDNKQTMFFSATMPEEITELVNSLMKHPVRVAVNPISSPVEVIRQQVYLLDRKNKIQLLAKLLREQEVKNALVFTRTKHGADKVTKELIREGIRAAAIHGNKSQTARQQALALFKSGKVQVLVATDIAARGLDIEELSHVFNYNLPEVPETYVHRIGRTGRAGRGGTAISFCDYSEEPLLRGVEALLGKPIARVEGHPFPMEEFELPRRDAKGRLVHADDEEARQAAREKRGRESSRGKVRPEQTEERKQQKLPRKTKEKLETRLDTPPFEEHTKASATVLRRNPLEGDVIMDATARLLAAKPLRKPSSALETPKTGGKPKGENRLPRSEEIAKQEANSDLKKENEKRTRRRRKSAKATNHSEEKTQNIGAKFPVMRTEKKEKQEVFHKEARGRAVRHNFPATERSRSRQKDSTEQPSLMKPFYIEHD